MRFAGQRWIRFRGFRALIAGSLFLAVFASSPQIASAHALLMRADPAADIVAQSSPTKIHLWFSEDLNGSASQITVWDQFRHVFNRGHAALVPGQSRQLQVGLKQPLHRGAYLVLWTSVSAQDGHVLHGSYLFFVKQRGPGPSLAGVATGGNGQSFPDATTLSSIAAHWLELLGITLWIGAAAFSTTILPRVASMTEPSRTFEAARVRVVLRASISALLLASCAMLALQLYSLTGQWSSAISGAAWREIFDVQYGRLWILRQLLALLALTGTFIASSKTRSLTSWRASGMHADERGSIDLAGRVQDHPGIVVALLGIIYAYALAASGHASSANVGTLDNSHIASLAIAVDWLHILGAGLWFGGQLYILLVLIPAVRSKDYHEGNARSFLDALNRFSPVAYLSVAAFTLSGPFNGAIHISSWYALFNSIYGRSLIVKVALISLMMTTSTVTVYVLRPRIQRLLDLGARPNTDPTPALIQLYRWLRVEPVLGVGVLLATSVMFYYPVPLGFAPPGPSSYVSVASNVTATVMLRPDRSGPNTVTVTLRDKRGSPVTAHVTVLSTMLDMVMGTGLGSLRQVTAGTYSGTIDLAMGGRWRLDLLVYQPSGTLVRMSIRARVGA